MCQVPGNEVHYVCQRSVEEWSQRSCRTSISDMFQWYESFWTKYHHDNCRVFSWQLCIIYFIWIKINIYLEWKRSLADTKSNISHWREFPKLYPNVWATVTSWVAYFMCQGWPIWFCAKVNKEVLVEGETSLLCVHVHHQKEGSLPVMRVILLLRKIQCFICRVKRLQTCVQVKSSFIISPVFNSICVTFLVILI